VLVIPRKLGVHFAHREEGVELGVLEDDADPLAKIPWGAGRGERVAVVGHQPDCGEIAAELTGGPEPSFAPGTVRAIELDNG
jgi:phosphohistidine phosphatase SixA